MNLVEFVKKAITYVRISAILTMSLFFYPAIYIFGFMMALACSKNPHKTGIKCVDKFNEVF